MPLHHWLLASIYNEGSRLGKLLELSFNGYSQTALCHYWPALCWASSQVCDIIRPLSVLLHTLTLPPHYTTESYTLFNKTDCQGINIRQHNSIIQQPIQSRPWTQSESPGLLTEGLPASGKGRRGRGLWDVLHNNSTSGLPSATAAQSWSGGVPRPEFLERLQPISPICWPK